jgi:acetyl-CoA carboxylase biotin carboxyl carrier protein
MNIKEVKDLVQEILQSDISEFELEHTGTRIRLKRGFGHDTAVISSAPALRTPVAARPPRQDPLQSVTEPPDSSEESGDRDLHVITSPIVGTVFCAPSPGAEPYVKVGTHVEEGSILCLVEAMKLMNEIPSDIKGEVVRIYIENSHPVEFGQKLFGIRPHIKG